MCALFATQNQIFSFVTTAFAILSFYLAVVFVFKNRYKLSCFSSSNSPRAPPYCGGVAEALIATAFGLLIAVAALFAYNYFSSKQDQTLDELERLATKVIDHIKLDQQKT